MKPTSVLTIALVLLAAAAPQAQDTTLGDARWVPWLGCWQLVQDDRGSIATAVATPDDVVVCVLPASGNRGVSMTTYVGGQSVLQQTVVGRWGPSPGERAGVQRESDKRVVAFGPAAPHTRRHHVHRPARTNRFRDHAHGRRADVGRHPGRRHRSGRTGTRPPLPTNRQPPAERGLAGRPPGTPGSRLCETGGSNGDDARRSGRSIRDSRGARGGRRTL